MPSLDIFYSNRNNPLKLAKNYDLIEKITPRMINGQNRYCLYHCVQENAKKKTIITSFDNSIRIGDFCLSTFDQGLVPYTEYTILIDESRRLARVKRVHGEEYDAEGLEYCTFTVDDIDEEDRFDDVYHDAGTVHDGDKLIRDNTEYSEYDINDGLTRYLEKIISKMESFEGNFFKETAINVSGNKSINPIMMVNEITVLSHDKTEGKTKYYLCECDKCKKMDIIRDKDISSYRCDHDTAYIYYY